MGTDYEYYDFNDNDQIVVDQMSVVEKGLRVQRECIEVEAGAGVCVSWGFRPVEPIRLVLPLAEETLFLFAHQVGLSEVQKIDGMVARREPLEEHLNPERDGSFEFVSVHSLRNAGGIYHILFPPFFMPVELRDFTQDNRALPVNAKKARNNRIAITWIFQNRLSLYMHLRQFGEKRFWEIPIAARVSPIGSTEEGGMTELMSKLKTLPTNTEFWNLVIKLWELSTHASGSS